MTSDLGHVVLDGAQLDDAVEELALPALLVRSASGAWEHLVHVYVPRHRTVAFTARDLRSPGIEAASEVARSHGFEPVVRSPGGRMVAYDNGAVVVDHVHRAAGLGTSDPQTFARTAAAHAQVLSALGVPDLRVGEVEGEYCPGEHSVNVGGTIKVIGAAQRVTGRATLFSSVVQVSMSDHVRDVIVAVSEALGYTLRESTIGGLRDVAPTLTAGEVAAAMADAEGVRLGLERGDLPREELARVHGAARGDVGAHPFSVDAWAREQSRS